jgi:hypothetical protein
LAGGIGPLRHIDAERRRLRHRHGAKRQTKAEKPSIGCCDLHYFSTAKT